MRGLSRRRPLAIAVSIGLVVVTVLAIRTYYVPDYCRGATPEPVAGLNTYDPSFYRLELTASPSFTLDGVSYFHPVHWAQTGLVLLANGRRADAVTVADQLWSHAQNGWFAYDFDWPPMAQVAPWYSAMAQGESLDLFASLGMWDRAHAVYATLAPSSPVVAADGWLLEYPGHAPVLNGAIFAAFGLYDYWQATGNPDIQGRFEAAVKPIARDVGDFRNPGHLSSYERSDENRFADYHRLQTHELQVLSGLAGMPCLGAAAADYGRDAAGAPLG